MTTRRTSLIVAAGLAAFIAATPLAQAACGRAAAAPPPPSVTGVAAAEAVVAAPSAAARAVVAAPQAAGAERLEAVRTVRHFCDLVDRGAIWRASDLFVTRGLWARRELRALETFRFRSARVVSAPDARTVTVLARVRVRGGRGSALGDGVATLFFTLGRVGTTTGGWLITAITTSP